MDRWANVCRSCLTTAESFSYFIYEHISPETYSFCTSIEVKRDELPKSLCDSCYDLLKKFSEFKNTCIQSENKLLDFSNSLKLEDKTGIILIEVKTEVIDENIDNVDGTAVLLKSDDKLDDDSSDTDICDDTNCQDQEEIVLKKKANVIKHEGLKVNSRTRKRPYNYTCELCSKKFVNRKGFENHKLRHEAPIQCKLCDKTFKTRKDLLDHKKFSHPAPSVPHLTCKVCSRVSKTPCILKRHYEIHEKRKVLCDECGRKFKDEAGLKLHLKTHAENRQRNFACQQCEKKYFTRSSLETHISRTHRARRFLCHYCDYPFSDKGVLIKHIKIHEGTQQLYKCDICSRELTSLASLGDHRRIHTGERPFECSFCEKRFKIKKGLMDHLRTHTGEKPFKCDVCELSFSQSNSKRRHMKVHDRLSS